MRKTFAAFVAVATIAGSLAATPASAQRGVAAGVAAPGRYLSPPHTEQVAGHTTILAVANGCNSVSMTAMAAGPPGASLRLIRDYGEIGRLIGTTTSSGGRRSDQGRKAPHDCLVFSGRLQ